MKILMATRNKGKIRELNNLLAEYIPGEKVELVSLDDIGFTDEIEENGNSFEENALIKAKAGCAATGLITVADDSGLTVEALGGAPGIYSARYSGGDDEANNDKLLSELQGVKNRECAYVCAMACVFPEGNVLSGAPIVVTGTCEGEILCARRGEGGFGYDPLFWFDPFGKTFGELSQEEKNAVSHRGEAVRKLAASLEMRIEAAKEKLWRQLEI
ncbi:MAG: RdgB/HAM1 family non-canonical purine NTP pyrophosphatase [Clostridia bacterium]|nr:RdgB/HAM1 family non-canonical purine NTP pyrophosphatase [Clostridia bacterium]